MTISDLTDYAAQKYHVREDVRWDGVPGFSVLSHPDTGHWVAVFVRRRDGKTGAEVVSCDLKCNADALSPEEKALFSLPERTRGTKWISIPLDKITDSGPVFRLLDKALALQPHSGSTIVIDHRSPSRKYSDIPIPFADSVYSPSRDPREATPERIRQMRRIMVLDRSPQGKAERFYRQAVFMKDYEDDCPWEGDFNSYYPTYNDMTDRQLRGYFTWRAAVRRGKYDDISESAAYLYVYELLNCVGGDTPEDCYRKLLEFKARFVEGGIGRAGMGLNLRRWVWEYAVIHGIAPATDYPFSQEDDLHLAALSSPEIHSDEEVFAALVNFGGNRYASSPAALFPEKGRRLFCRVWRKACAGQEPLKDAFTVCFGPRRPVRWTPLENALYYPMSEVPEDRRKKGWSVNLKGGVSREYPSDVPDMEYTLNEGRSFFRKNGLWRVSCWHRSFFRLNKLKSLLRETDRRLRLYLKTGKYLKDETPDQWAAPFIDAAVAEDIQAERQAAIDRVRVDLSGLDNIRRDAAETRERLLTEEEREQEAAAGAADPDGPADSGTEDEPEETGPDSAQLRILRALLAGEDPGDIIRAEGLLPSVVADDINEALYDEIGDTAVLCEGDVLILVEDYAEDIERYLGGMTDD